MEALRLRRFSNSPEITRNPAEKQPDSHVDNQAHTQERAIKSPLDGPRAPVDVVESALADALQKAATAGAWSTVERLATELEARRKERLNAAGVAPVVTLNSARKGES